MPYLRSLLAPCLALATVLGCITLSACDRGSAALQADGGVAKSGCQARFSPERAARGEDCRPRYHEFCPSAVESESDTHFEQVPPCEGVRVVEVREGELDYVALIPEGSPRTLVMSLHFQNSDAPTYAAQMRLSELAKGRRTLVVLPNAPGRGWPQWRLVDGVPDELNLADRQTIDDSLRYLDATLSDAQQRFAATGLPALVSGLSNGASAALRYGCRYPLRVEAVMAVAGSIGELESRECRDAPPVGSVQVHGTADPISPYRGQVVTPSIPALFNSLRQRNHCAGPVQRTILPATAEVAGAPVIDYDRNCSGRSSFLVTIEHGGHAWPGYDNALGLPVNAYGPLSRDFDATLQGYDLMAAAAGLP